MSAADVIALESKRKDWEKRIENICIEMSAVTKDGFVVGCNVNRIAQAFIDCFYEIERNAFLGGHRLTPGEKSYETDGDDKDRTPP